MSPLGSLRCPARFSVKSVPQSEVLGVALGVPADRRGRPFGAAETGRGTAGPDVAQQQDGAGTHTPVAEQEMQRLLSAGRHLNR